MNGLLLIGGKSSRMGTDKAELVIRDGMSQKQRGLKLLSTFCENVYLSTSEALSTSEPYISDRFGSIGPLGAIASAQQSQPNTAWLVLACDLPMIEEVHLQNLIDARNEQKDAVYYKSASDQNPEPLCAIWEACSAQHVTTAIKNGSYCPRDLLKKLNGHSLEPLDLWSLANTNTPEDLIEIKTRINGEVSKKEITLTYFAQLRELIQKDSEQHITESVSPAGVFEEIRKKHTLQLKRRGMMVAINGEFSDWSHPLKAGDELVFIPPVAGG